MKHIMSLNQFSANIVEGLNFNNTQDADLLKLTTIFASQNSQLDENQIKEFLKEAMNNAKPVSLSGKIKKDAIEVVNYLVSAFKKEGILLDSKNASIDNNNEIIIPLLNFTKLCFNVNLDYCELLNNGGGKKFVIQGQFENCNNASKYYSIDSVDSIADINDNAQIVKAVSSLKVYFESTDDNIH